MDKRQKNNKKNKKAIFLHLYLFSNSRRIYENA